jgi:hypothetical protein
MVGWHSLLGFTKVSIVVCGRSYLRTFLFLLNINADRFVPLYRCIPIRRGEGAATFAAR